MTELAQFHKGQPVRHVGMGAGEVLKNEAGAVYVEYKTVDRRGFHNIGIYDELWFRLHPNVLSHAPSP